MWPFKRKGGKTEQIQAYSKKNERLASSLEVKTEEVKQQLDDEDISIKIYLAIRKADGK